MTTKLLFDLPQKVRDDIADYRGHIENYLKGIDKDHQKHFCAGMGVYEQRQKGEFMVRVRIAAGTASTTQVKMLAELSMNYGDGILHVTSRQDIQIHGVSLENTADVQEELLKVELSARGGGGNTLRNVTAPARSGVDPEEEFDVRPYAIAVAEYLLQFDGAYHLPRKYKIAFSSNAKDESFASVNDLGFIAKEKDGKQGFVVFAAGGLGRKPRAGILLHDWLDGSRVLHASEAIRRVFDKHGDRENRNTARLRYVAERVGDAEFLKLYNDELAALDSAPHSGQVPKICPAENIKFNNANALADTPANIHKDKAADKFSIELKLSHGDISADDLITVAETAEKYGENYVRASQTQNLFICRVSKDDIDNASADLSSIKVTQNDILICTGSSKCRLGICDTQSLLAKIEARFEDAGVAWDEKQPTLRISGCPNSCGNHQTAGIGLEGCAKKVAGEVRRFYNVYKGGSIGINGATIGTTSEQVAEDDVPDYLLKLL